MNRKVSALFLSIVDAQEGVWQAVMPNWDLTCHASNMGYDCVEILLLAEIFSDSYLGEFNNYDAVLDVYEHHRSSTKRLDWLYYDKWSLIMTSESRC